MHPSFNWKPWLLIGSLFLMPSFLSCDRRSPIRSSESISGQTMGTTYSVKYLPEKDTPGLEEIGALVEVELESVNAQMSTYRENSEISRFNAQTSSDWFPVSKETAEVVQLSLKIWDLTEGSFDVTVGPMVDLWGFGPTPGTDSVPDPAVVRELLLRVGSDKLSVRLEPPALRKLVGGLRVDLSAVATGPGVDRVAEVLEVQGLKNYFVEIGGEIRTRGVGAHGRAWQVGIERPNLQQREVQQVVGLSGKSMATSGDYRNFRSLGEFQFSHFIDPRTGMPVETEVAAATVLAEDCATADAWATGLMSAGLDKAQALVARHDLPVMLIVRRQDGFETINSPKFAEWLSADELSSPIE
jgi:thiamine biosynthesis lipoprotein